MPQLVLTVTEGIDLRRAEKLATELRGHLEVAEPCTFVRRYSDVATITQYIQLLGDVIPVAGVTLFGEGIPLADVAKALADAREASSGHVEIIVGLDIPDPSPVRSLCSLHMRTNSRP